MEVKDKNYGINTSDWVIGNKTCAEADQDSNSYACKDLNSECIDGPRSVGYRCRCKDGYEGNPYLNAGCNDINECERKTDDCEHECNNTQGGYNCTDKTLIKYILGKITLSSYYHIDTYPFYFMTGCLCSWCKYGI
ncbi:hypothetical protein POM88_052485 [Heracleum sosnowskyi]|uniref:NOTCH1 EGF-like calcium-binding domain-containing protein n=1 Tax=Heracleum sosnowskyi TaxID=360622 RepID=A0AAD8GSG0_9APIA|nr:hypothetical protein POM88_052485 [Heracleum sosnowskyi]